MRKARKIASMANDQCKEQESGTSKTHKKSNDQFILLRRWTSVISKMRSWNPNFQKYHLGGNDYRFDVLQILFFELLKNRNHCNFLRAYFLNE